MPPPRVFISAKSDDYEFAEQVFRHLVAAGVTVFFSQESLPQLGNADYRREIDRALDEADHMVVVSSAAEHVRSPWVEAEWGFFINEKRSGRKAGNLVTVLVGGLGVADLPPSLRSYEAIAFDPRLFDRLASYLGVRRAPAAPPPAPAAASAAPPRLRSSFGGSPPITMVLASSASGVAVTAGHDGAVRLYDIASGERRAVLGGRRYWTSLQDSPVMTMVFSPDGGQLVSGHGDGTVHVWQVDEGREIGELKHDSAIGGLAFSPDGTTLVTGSRDGVVRFWEVAGLGEGRAPVGAASKPAPIAYLAYQPQSNWIVSGLLNTATGRHALQIERVLPRTSRPDRTLATVNLAAPYRLLTIAPDGRLLAASGRDGVVRIYDWAAIAGAIAGKQNPRLVPLLAEIAIAGDAPSGLAFLSASTRLAVATGTSISIRDMPGGKEAVAITDDDGERYVSVTRCGADLLLGALADGRVRVWEIGHLQSGVEAVAPAAAAPRPAGATLLAEVVDELVSGDHDRVRLGVGRIPAGERPAYVAVLKGKLLTGSSVERRSSLTALFLLRDASLPAALIQAAADPEASVRREAMFLIGRARVRQALEVVNQRLSDGNVDVRAAARDAHQKLTGRRG